MQYIRTNITMKPREQTKSRTILAGPARSVKPDADVGLALGCRPVWTDQAVIETLQEISDEAFVAKTL
jgi:hypothetical protein